MGTQHASLYLFLLFFPPLLLLPSFTHAYPPPEPPHHTSLHLTKGVAIMVFVAVSLLVIAFMSFLFQRWRGQNSFNRSTPARPLNHARVSKRGLDPAIIHSIPSFLYSDIKERKKQQPGTVPPECAVCLSEFSGHEIIRLLPACCHAFHLDCIDMWLESHTTCPVCRAELDGAPSPPVGIETATPAEVEAEAAGAQAEERERLTLQMATQQLQRCRSVEGGVEVDSLGRGTWVGNTLSERWAACSRPKTFEMTKVGTSAGTSSGDAANMV